jgi:hypothetical protein
VAAALLVVARCRLEPRNENSPPSAETTCGVVFDGERQDGFKARTSLPVRHIDTHNHRHLTRLVCDDGPDAALRNPARPGGSRRAKVRR